MPAPEPQWRPRRVGQASDTLTKRFGRILGQVAWARGYDKAEDVEALLSPRLDTLKSPFLMKNMEAAAARVATAVQNKEPLCVYADYDIDGMSGLAVLVSFLKACGAENVTSFQPDRLTDGYGVHPEAIRSIAEQGTRVIITVDTGISAHAAALEAQKIGVELIVTDHHQQLGELPVGACVVNPNQQGDTSGLGYLSGAGVAFYLAIGVRSKLRDAGWFNSGRPQPDLRSWLDIFVLGTIADQVELVGDNRALVRAGLEQLKKSQRAGLAELRNRVFAKVDTPSAQDVAFLLTPKLNAASRMGRAELSTELLLTENPERAEELTNEILNLNQKRSSVQAEIIDEALLQAEAEDNPITVVSGTWHEGVLGVVAAKLVEKLRKPAIVLAKLPHEEGMLRGSMRTHVGISCVAALEACKELLVRFGGHEMAAGLQLHESNFEAFKALLHTEGTRLSQMASAPDISFDGALSSDPLLPAMCIFSRTLAPGVAAIRNRSFSTKVSI